MKHVLLCLGLALGLVGAAGCKRKQPPPPPPAVVAEAPAPEPPPPEVIGEHLTAQTLAEDLVLYTLQVEFDTDQAVIRSEYFPDLDKIGLALTRDPGATARVEGHADRRNSSAPDHNLQLSRQRAAAVADYLKSKVGIDAARLTTAGFGYDRPLEANDPVNGSARNRRVEIYVRQSPPSPIVAPPLTQPATETLPPAPETAPAVPEKAPAAAGAAPAAEPAWPTPVDEFPPPAE